jgi:hypothetical protein
VNAAERAESIVMANRIATTVNLFKAQFPDVRVDLKPWANDADTRDLVDPDSIDLGFHFPGLSRSAACRSMLVQIRFFTDPLDGESRAIGVDIAGYDHRGQQWQLSTVENWRIIGNTSPKPEIVERFRAFCRQVFEVFNRPWEESA